MRRSNKGSKDKNIHNNNQMKTCFDCGVSMERKSGVMPDGIPYEYYKCPKCQEEVLDMKQLGDVAERFKEYKRMKAKISRWGSSLGIRIPKELVKKYKLKPNNEVTFVAEENGIRIVT